MTTLEAELIVNYIRAEKPELLRKLKSLPHSSLNQKTTNEFAAACLKEEEDLGEIDSWDMTPCQFLENDCCTIYPVRSFMCRSFGSKVPCNKGGEAEVEPLFLSLNTIILQCIEHLDQGRPWGNMNTILKMLEEESFDVQGGLNQDLRLAEPIPGFLIPPDEMEDIHNKLQILLEIIDRP